MSRGGGEEGRKRGALIQTRADCWRLMQSLTRLGTTCIRMGPFPSGYELIADSKPVKGAIGATKGTDLNLGDNKTAVMHLGSTTGEMLTDRRADNCICLHAEKATLQMTSVALSGPDSISRGPIQITGTSCSLQEGHEYTGQWPLASGQHTIIALSLCSLLYLYLQLFHSFVSGCIAS